MTLCKVPMIYANVLLDDTVIDSTVIKKSLLNSSYIYGAQIIGEPKDRTLPAFQISMAMYFSFRLLIACILLSARFLISSINAAMGKQGMKFVLLRNVKLINTFPTSSHNQKPEGIFFE